VLEDGPEAVGVKSLPSKVLRTSILGFSGVGSAMVVSLIGVVKESDPEQSLFCLRLDRDRETWCRLRSAGAGVMPDVDVGQEVAVFAWGKWVSHILDVIHVESLTGR